MRAIELKRRLSVVKASVLYIMPMVLILPTLTSRIHYFTDEVETQRETDSSKDSPAKQRSQIQSQNCLIPPSTSPK